MYFTNDELGPDGSKHNKLLYITVWFTDVLVGKVLINDGFAWNVPHNWDLGSGIVRGAINVPGDIIGDRHSSILQHIVGKFMDPYGWSSSFLTVTGCRDVEATMRFYRASWGGVCVLLGKDFGFNHKIIIKVQESSPSIMITKNLLSMRVWVRDWLCKEKMHSSQYTLPKVNYIVVWLFF